MPTQWSAKDLLIVAQNSGTIASNLTGAEATIEEFETARARVFDGALALVQGELDVYAEAAITTAFPGTQSVATVPVPQQGQPAPVVTPAAQYSPPTPPSPPPAPPQAANGGGQCPKCGGAMYDNRSDNARKRAGGYKLGPDLKCKDQSCGKAIWPADFEAFKHLPPEPR